MFLQRLLHGDRVAFVQITGVIMAVISRMRAFELRDSWADIAQDVLEAVLENVQRGTLREPNALITYTQTITRRRVLHWLEHHGKRPAPTDPEQLPALTRDASAPDPGLRVDLERALEELPPACRRVIQETYVNGRTYAETARSLDLSLRQIKRLQSRGLALLRVALTGRD